MDETEKLSQELSSTDSLPLSDFPFYRLGSSTTQADRQAFLDLFPLLSDRLKVLLPFIDDRIATFVQNVNRNRSGDTYVRSSESTPTITLPPFDPDATLPLSQHIAKTPEVISLSNPGRILAGDISNASDETLPIADRRDGHRMSFDVAPISGDATQSIFPCQFGDYVLKEVLGRGGMGVVYLASQTSLERNVALKMIRSGALASEEEVHRFYSEAKSAARLEHPNIVTVYQCGELNGHHYFAMDYIPGTDLSKRLKAHPLSAREAARYVRDVARAIAFAHSEGVLHRDLKPANILIDNDDNVVLTDFGLAKLIDSDGGMTRSGTALGTPSYMAPEQASGDNDEHGPASDVYSMGAILFALVTGKPPFESTNALQTIMAVIHQPAPDVKSIRSDLPIDLATIIQKCLEKSVSDRYASANDLADELDRFLIGEPIRARPATVIQKSVRVVSGVPIIAAVLGYRNQEPTVAQKWLQRAIIGMFFLFPLFCYGTWRIYSNWVDNRIPNRFAIGSGVPGGSYHALAERIATLIESNIGVHPLVYSTEGSEDNAKRLLDRKIDIALLQTTSIRSEQIAVIAPLYYEALHVIARRSSNVHKLSDLREKKIAIGSADSGTRQVAMMILDYLNLNETDYRTVSEEWNSLADDDSIDVAFSVIRVRHPALSEMLRDDRFELIPLMDAQEISLNEPSFKPYALTDQDYSRIGVKPIETLAITAFLATRRNASSRLVKECLNAIYDDKMSDEGLVPLKKAANWQGIPLHPASRNYYQRVIIDQ